MYISGVFSSSPDRMPDRPEALLTMRFSRFIGGGKDSEAMSVNRIGTRVGKIVVIRNEAGNNRAANKTVDRKDIGNH